MDAVFLNFHKEEDFSSYFSSYEEDSQSYDGLHSSNANSYRWLDYERELNGDMGLIPMPSETSFALSTSPPVKEDFNKIMSDWNHLVNLEVDAGLADGLVDPIRPPHEEDALLDIKAEEFDIAAYVVGEPEIVAVKQEPEQAPIEASAKRRRRTPQKFGGKRIDMARGRYMLDAESTDDEDVAVDVETVEGEVSHPVLQAGDLDSLLEQFEATETTNMALNQQRPGTPNGDCRQVESDIALDVVEQVQLVSPIKSPPKDDKRLLLDFREAAPVVKVKTEWPAEEVVRVKVEAPQSPAKEQRKNNKQILDALPAELIDRIRASSKRKPVPVIEPVGITPKRRMLQSGTQTPNLPAKTTIPTASTTINGPSNASVGSSDIVKREVVMLDHDYCTYAYRKEAGSAKDSGFSSAEEDEKVIRTQPTIKSSDGKLMVSLLKSNTIKKKLNLEEYKKRLLSRPESGGRSPSAVADDENARRLRHTEMLMKLAADHLSKNAPPLVADVSSVKKEKKEEAAVDVEVDTKRPPRNIVMKTLVSVGTNTEECWGHLEQILQDARIKISPNSLISSIVEQLPKVSGDRVVEHGEDKTIVFVDTTRPKRETRAAHVQTTHSSGHLLGRRRRRSSSASSSSSSSSCDSYDSARGSRYHSRSRSRTPSPARRKNQQLAKEVEERRVVYVGKLADDVTKEDLRRRFARFGPITNLSVHFRRRADNYGFVTFVRKEDAYAAVERGNDDPDEPEYDLSFGGRRLFCQTTYADLDNMQDDDATYDEYAPHWQSASGAMTVEGVARDDNSFDNLLRKAQAKLRNRKI